MCVPLCVTSSSSSSSSSYLLCCFCGVLNRSFFLGVLFFLFLSFFLSCFPFFVGFVLFPKNLIHVLISLLFSLWVFCFFGLPRVFCNLGM